MKSVDFPQREDTGLRWITVTTLLLAIGAILRLVSPNLGGVSLNWNIVMYCLAIMLCRPTPRQGIGIGLVSGLVATLTSKAALPYANLVSDPLAGLVCAYLAQHRVLDLKIGKISFEPAILVFVTTCISGGAFVTITKLLLNLPMTVYIYAMLPTVFIVAALGMTAGQILYQPASKIFSMKAASALNNLYVLSNIDLTVPRGSFCVLTGANGSGKTTLLQMIAGARISYLQGVRDSNIQVADIDILADSTLARRTKVGMVMADYEGQLVTETVGDEVAFSLENMGLSKAVIQKRQEEVLTMTGLTGLNDRKIATLSGGQKQRLAIAVMIAADAEILLLDEPIAAIDPEGARDIYNLLHQLNKKYNKTIIVAEHDLKYIDNYATQLAVMDKGKLCYTGTMAECLDFMYRSSVYEEAVPLKWKINMEMEAVKNA